MFEISTANSQTSFCIYLFMWANVQTVINEIHTCLERYIRPSDVSVYKKYRPNIQYALPPNHKRGCGWGHKIYILPYGQVYLTIWTYLTVLSPCISYRMVMYIWPYCYVSLTYCRHVYYLDMCILSCAPDAPLILLANSRTTNRGTPITNQQRRIIT